MVLVVAMYEERPERARGLDLRLIGGNQGYLIDIDGGTGKDTDRSAVSGRIVSSRLKRMQCTLQEEPLLRIDKFGLLRTEVKILRVKQLYIRDRRGRFHVIRISKQLVADPVR